MVEEKKDKLKFKDDEPLGHLSPSQVDRIEKCGLQWDFRYNRKIIMPPNVAMVKGSSCHYGAKENFTQKIESHIDLKPSDVGEMAVTYYEANTDDMELNFEDKGRNRDDVIGENKDLTYDLMVAFMETFAPTVQPKWVETKQEIVIPQIKKSFLGIIDLIDIQDWVRDTKVSAKKKSQADADNSFQLSSYALIFKARFGYLPPRVVLDCLVNYVKGARVVTVESQRTDKDLQRCVSRILNAPAVIESGNFTAAPADAWWCTPKFCGYWPICECGGK